MKFLSQKAEDILSKLGMIAAPFLYVWSVWQHENLIIWHSISVDPLNTTILPWPQWWESPSKIFFFIVWTNGAIYDTTLLVGGVAFLILGISMLYQKKKYTTLKRRYDALKKDENMESV